MVLLACSIVLLAPARPADAAGLSAQLQDLADRINAYRSANGLPSLTVSATLTSSAQWMSSNMATYDYVSHTSIDGRTPQQRITDAGYNASATWTGEDIAAGYNDAASTLVGWENSPSHNAVLLNGNYHAIGLGYAYGAGTTYGSYWVADFGGIVDSVIPRDTGYHAQWVGQSGYPTLAPGEIATLSVSYRNVGARVWQRGVAGAEARIGTNEPTDRAYPELAWNWLIYDRPSSQDVSLVNPGDVTSFSFTVHAPPTPGTYRLALRPVVDGVAWMEDYGVYLLITVR